jgi:hypothetical protein
MRPPTIPHGRTPLQHGRSHTTTTAVFKCYTVAAQPVGVVASYK